MPIRNLHKLFHPEQVVVVGEEGPADAVVANLLNAGYGGKVWAIGNSASVAAGANIEVFATLPQLPQPPDLAIVCGHAQQVPNIVQQCGESGVGGIAILTSGFRETGEFGAQLEHQIQRQKARFPRMRILGPNCLGLVAPHGKLNASFVAGLPKPGRVAFISQSGTFCSSALDWALGEDVGFSYFVSIGNMLEIGFSDLIDYFALDPLTDAMILYVESIDDARRFMSAARATTQKKPIVVFKAGRYPESAAAAASHTGALAGVDAVYEAAFERAGIVRVPDVDDMFDCAQLLARKVKTTGPQLAIVTNAGGPGVVAVDSLIERRGELAKLAPRTIAELDAFLPPFWSRRNPVDILEDAGPQRFVQASRAVLDDSSVDALMVILTPQAMTDATSTAVAIGELAGRSRKPLLAVWMGGPAVRRGTEFLQQVGIPTYSTPKNAVHAFLHMTTYARRREILLETPRELPVTLSTDKLLRHETLDRLLAVQGDILLEHESKQVLATFGITSSMPQLAANEHEAALLANAIGYPVVLKVVSPQIIHKYEVGGVALNLTCEEEVRRNFRRILETVSLRRADATIEGISVQRMVSGAGGVELIVGSRKDPVFGAVVMIGAGGVAAEAINDVALGLPPLNERLARHMLQSLRTWPILAGERGRPSVNIDHVIATLIRFSYMVAECPQIGEIDVNPLLATPTEVIALDARIKIEHQASERSQRPYAHLAIHPYPEKLIRCGRLDDETPVTLRPIRPEDEPLWQEMVAACSPESIRSRFRSLFKEMTHEMASAFCFIDYDRELVIVAERQHEGRRELIGCGHLVCDVDHHDAEYAVLVRDQWQGRGLGRLLTAYCVEIAETWDLEQLIGETTRENARMIATFRGGGFEVEYDAHDDVMVARRRLAFHPPPSARRASVHQPT